MWKKLLCCAVVGLFVFGLLAGLGDAETEKPLVQVTPPVISPKFATHNPIRINNDTDFTSQFSNRTIWGLDINGTNNGFCIYIANCSLPFSIKNCYLHSAKYGWYYAGLYMYNSSNAMISNNNCSENSYGIWLYNTNSNRINSNSFYANGECAIKCLYSNRTTFTRNTCYNAGIFLYRSRFDELRDNKMMYCGFYIEGSSLADYTTHIISSDNSVNNKPEAYIKNTTGVQVPQGAGQVIIANCSDIIVQKQDVSYTSVGVQIAFSNNCVVSNISSNFSRIGIQDCNSKNNKIMDNNINGGGSGIYIYNTEGDIIKGTNLEWNQYGIRIENSQNNSLINNRGSKNSPFFISLSRSNNTTLLNNTCSKLNGIGIFYSNNNHIIRNNISNGFIFLGTSIENKIENNSIIGDGGSGIGLDDGSNNNLFENNFLSTDGVGFYFSTSLSNTLKNNKMINCSIMFGTINPEKQVSSDNFDNISYYTSQIIGPDNIVNGKPVVYLKNKVGFNVTTSAGEVILANCSHIRIDHQDLSNTNVGLYTAYTDNSIITNNTFNSTKEAGIFLHSSNNNIIERNSVYASMKDGIFVEGDYNTIKYNNICECKIDGISLLGNYNRVHHNNLINNDGMWQADDAYSDNFWNTSTEGNYWSNWTHPDFNHDGIVDIPYNITRDAKTRDYFPLVNPVSNAGVVPAFSPAPALIICAILLTAIAASRRKP